MKYNQVPLTALSLEREDNYITYTVEMPKGMQCITPVYNNRDTVFLVDTGFRYTFGGEQQLRFRYSSGIPYTSQEFPKVGDIIAVAVEVEETPREPLKLVKKKKPERKKK